MKSIEFYEERAIDAVKEGFSNEKGSKSFFEIFEELKCTGKYEKITAVIKIINELAPKFLSDEIIKQLTRIERRGGQHLPFNPKKFNYAEKIGNGGEHRVFLLESNDYNQPSYALKINHSISGSLDEITQEAAKFRKEYEEIKKLYSSIPNIVPDELTMVVAHPKYKKPVVATIQKFFGGEIKDVLRNFDENELINLLNSDVRLRTDFQKFYEITEEEKAKNGKSLDIVGKNNLSIISTQEGLKLVILDAHNSVSENDKHNRNEQQEELMSELKKIFNALHQ